MKNLTTLRRNLVAAALLSVALPLALLACDTSGGRMMEDCRKATGIEKVDKCQGACNIAAKSDEERREQCGLYEAALITNCPLDFEDMSKNGKATKCLDPCRFLAYATPAT